MVYYLRVICTKNWIPKEGTLFENIDGEAITTDLRCDKNEWSLYRIEGEYLQRSKIERVAVKAAALMLHRLAYPLSIVAFSEDYLKGLGLGFKWSPTLGEGEVGSWHYNAKPIRFCHIDKAARSIYQDILQGENTVFKYGKEDLLGLIARYPADFIGGTEKDTLKRRRKSFQKAFGTLQSNPYYAETLSKFDKAINED